MQIRAAAVADIPAITSLYNWAIDNTLALWIDEHVDEANRAEWLANARCALVAYDGDEFVGFASYGQFRPYSGYRHTVENSIYVHPHAQGRGVGGQLLRALVEYARGDESVHVVVAAIESSNIASIALHRRAGFENAGHLCQVGWVKGEWRDLQFMQLLVDA